jgi:hypothetical protein
MSCIPVEEVLADGRGPRNQLLALDHVEDRSGSGNRY